MANITDVFAVDGFDTLSLTSAMNKLPASETTIADLGIFETTPVNGTLIAVEDKDQSLALLPTTQRGQRGVESKADNRKIRNFTVPHVQIDDTVFTDDILNVRQFGTNDNATGIAQVVGDKLANMKRSIDTTNEYLRMRCLHGDINYPTNSVDDDLDIYSAFGTSEQTVNMLLDTTTTKVVETIIPKIRDAVETALGGTPYTTIVALAGREFFRALIGHGLVRELYLTQSQFANQLGNVDFLAGKPNRQQISIAGVTFIEYFGSTSGQTSIDTDHARAFPIGVEGMYQSITAPADFIEAAGTLGVPFYARTYPTLDGKGMNLEVQSNQLHLCMRPRALVKLIQHTGD